MDKFTCRAAKAAFFLLALGGSALATSPNFVVIFGDDWGWGDLGANWPATKGLTPNLDAIAETGVRFTDFHVAASVCTPSRAGLMTGRLGLRTGVVSNFGPSSLAGLPKNETTLAEMLKTAPTPYRTGMVGKWHLGTFPGYFPTDRGFDSYVGVPYSIDMGCAAQPSLTGWICSNDTVLMCPACPLDPNPIPKYFPPDKSCGRKKGCADADIGIPIFENKTIVQQPGDLSTLSARYGDEIERFIQVSAESGDPFFLYFAASHVHVPMNVAPSFTNASGRSSPFADALLEFDHTVGRLTAALKANGVAEDTVIFVTGDNGPWACKCGDRLAGSPGPFTGSWMHTDGREGSSLKTTVWEGGHRVVGLANWPGKIPGNVTSPALTSSLDYMPTMAELAGVHSPPAHTDGISLAHLLQDHGLLTRNDSAHTTLFHPLSGAGGNGPLDAMRWGKYKAHWTTGGAYDCGGKNSAVIHHLTPLLFDLDSDPGESNALDTKDKVFADVVRQMSELRQQKLDDIESQPRSRASYKIGPEGRKINCCNEDNVACRCTH